MSKNKRNFVELFNSFAKRFFLFFFILWLMIFPFISLLFFLSREANAEGIDWIEIHIFIYVTVLSAIVALKVLSFNVRIWKTLFGPPNERNTYTTAKGKMHTFIGGMWTLFAIESLALMGYATFTPTEHGWLVKIALMGLDLLAIPILSFIGYRSMVKFWEQ